MRRPAHIALDKDWFSPARSNRAVRFAIRTVCQLLTVTPFIIIFWSGLNVG